MAYSHSLTTLAALLMLSFTLLPSHAQDTGGWEWVSSLRYWDAYTFGQKVRPLVQIAMNTYRPTKYATDVPGFAPAKLVPRLGRSLNTQIPGPRAVVYEELSTGNIVLSFKGAQDQADYCAVGFMMGGISCWGYQPSTIDYTSSAVRYVRRVMRAYPSRPILLSGHSMGSFLAHFVSATIARGSHNAVVLPVLSFSGPVAENSISQKGLNMVAAWRSQDVVISSERDPVGNPSEYRSQQNFDHTGVLCTYTAPRPWECFGCDYLSPSTWPCSSCFSQTHPLENLLELLDDGYPVTCRDES